MRKSKLINLMLIFFILIILFLTNIVFGFNITKRDNIKNLEIRDNKTLNIQRGDIVFRYVDEDVMPFCSFMMHPAVFTGEVIEDGSSSGDLYKFIEARGDPDPSECKVKYTYYSEHRIFNLSVLCDVACRVKGNSVQIGNAVGFMEWRIGDKLVGVWKKPLKEFNPERDNTWYCTEIIWAAFMNSNATPKSGLYGRGINIGGIGQIITSNDILNSPNVEQIRLLSDKKAILPNLYFLNIFNNIREKFIFSNLRV